MSTELTAERLRELLHYDPDTGVFTRLVVTSNRVKIGAIAGTIGTWGYRVINIMGARRYAHRLAWLYVHGTWPAHHIDHINGVRHDNRICNLRAATNAENMYNRGATKSNPTGFKGITWLATRKKWQAQIKAHGIKKTIGYFDCPAAAHAAYCEAAEKLHGAFWRTA